MNMLSSPNKYQFESMWLSNRIFIKEPDIELIKKLSDFHNVLYIKKETLQLVREGSTQSC